MQFTTPKKQPGPPMPETGSLELERRIKVLEDGLANIRRKVLVNEQNELNRHKRVMTDEKSLQEEINGLKKDIEAIKQNLKEVISELREAARKEDVEVLRRYIDIWNPTQFVRQSEIDKIIEEKMG